MSSKSRETLICVTLNGKFFIFFRMCLCVIYVSWVMSETEMDRRKKIFRADIVPSTSWFYLDQVSNCGRICKVNDSLIPIEMLHHSASVHQPNSWSLWQRQFHEMLKHFENKLLIIFNTFIWTFWPIVFFAYNGNRFLVAFFVEIPPKIVQCNFHKFILHK